ncbi:uroporphyrinogen-III C-methyltransferase [Paenibacillus chartarius]|uniref:uroporphyrinogen-III C-methyltransferase n=1 Tax=Paenibacillus chartarius TaxID=747481 RepID=A0ABV6DJ22_9BACL
MNKGKVYLIGAGPGDPKLITVRGLEAIKKADVIVYDRLATPRLLLHRREGAKLVYVGKTKDKHMMKQEDINRLLAELALEGHTVARLKGGDPSIFGRVGEEAEELTAHGVPFEIIPGVTSAIAAPAYAGIPVTHRDFTSSFTIVTGHEYPNKTYSAVDWENIAKASGTLVFLMGVANIEHICSELLSYGKPPELPVALIRWGTWMEQRTLTGTLATIAEKVKATGFESPAVIIVGEVVKLRDKLAWFEKKPLFGRRILVTRARSQASELVDRIDELGGEPVQFPVIRLREPTRPEALMALDDALHRLSDYDWVLFTSVNGVDYFFRRLIDLSVDVRQLAGVRVGAVGPKTAEALRQRGIMTEPLPLQFQADALAAALEPLVQAGQRVLLPAADIAKETLPKALKAMGLNVEEVDVYENVISLEGGEEALELLRQRAINAITFTSSSTVTNLLRALEMLGESEPLALLRGIDIACIGPVTAQTALKAGLTVTHVAEQATIESLLQSLVSNTNHL